MKSESTLEEDLLRAIFEVELLPIISIIAIIIITAMPNIQFLLRSVKMVYVARIDLIMVTEKRVSNNFLVL
jgi:hypothetical protein